MGLTVLYTPPLLCYSKNPIIARIATDSGVGTRMDCIILDNTSGSPVIIGTVMCYADNDGWYTFKLNKIIDSYMNTFDLEDPAAAWDDTILKLQKTAINLIFSFEEGTGFTTAFARRVIKGGISKISFQREPEYWTEYFAVNKSWISWLPNLVKVGKTQPLFLTYNNYNEVVGGKLRVKVYFTDGTFTTVDKAITADIEEDTFYLVKAGYTQLDVGSVDITKTVYCYEVWMADSSNAILCASKKILVAYKYEPYERFFMYMGSSGNIEVIRTTGKASYKPEISSSFVDREDQVDINEDNVAEYVVPVNSNEYDLQKRKTIKLSSGPKTSYEVQLFEDFRISQWKAEYIPGIGIIPITIDDKTPDLGKDGDTTNSFAFTYKYAHTENIFTPDNLTRLLGA